MSDHSFKFRGRVILEEGLIEIETWDDELTPADITHRPVRDWAKESLQNWSASDFHEHLGIPPGEYEIVFEGEIRGHLDQYSGEWDEDIDIVSFKHQPIPVAWRQE